MKYPSKISPRHSCASPLGKSRLGSFSFFQDEARLLLDRKMTAMLRIHRNTVSIGDRFYADATGLIFEITSIQLLLVSEAARNHHLELGYKTRKSFLAYWWAIHPLIGGQTGRYAHLISFKLVTSQIEGGLYEAD